MDLWRMHEWHLLLTKSLLGIECISEHEEINPEQMNELDDVPEYSKVPQKKEVRKGCSLTV